MAIPQAALSTVMNGISSAGGILSANISDSKEQSKSESYSWGDSSSYGYTNAANAANAYDYSAARTYGDLATEWDRVNAANANAVQEAFLQKQMQYNAAEAAKTRNWETYMSNTSYQRAVKDLIAAGLNPILAAGNMGATTPTGASASSALATSHKANSYANSESYGSGSSSSWGASGGENWSESTEGSRSRSKSQSESHSEPTAVALYHAIQQQASSAKELANATADAIHSGAVTAGSAQYSAPTVKRQKKKG